MLWNKVDGTMKDKDYLQTLPISIWTVETWTQLGPIEQRPQTSELVSDAEFLERSSQRPDRTWSDLNLTERLWTLNKSLEPGNKLM